MNKMVVNKSEVSEYIKDTLYSLKDGEAKIGDTMYHHNTSYANAPLVCKHGILSLLELNKLKIRNDSLETLKKLNDTESHPNGITGISLSVLGLDDLYDYEIEYDPLDSSVVDFIVSSDIDAYRYTTNYGNEFVCYNSIGLDKILYLDFRLLEYIKLSDKSNISSEELINMYNNLLQAAINLRDANAKVILREMSKDASFNIDILKFSKSKFLTLKK